MQSVVGNPNAVLKCQEPSYNVDTGLTLREVWTGTRAAVVSKLAFYASLGYNGTTAKITGGSWQLVINVPSTVYDKWEWDTDWEQVSLFSSPDVDAEMQLFASNALYQQRILDAVAKGDQALPSSFNGFPMGQLIFRLLSRGVESYERRRTVLRLRRMVPTDWALPMVQETYDNIYLTESLQALFNIPNVIATQFPNTPNITPADTIWAWKTRAQTSDSVPAINKTEEQIEWVFAAWPFNYYNVV